MEMSKNYVGKMPEGFKAWGGGQAVKMASEEKLFQMISGGKAFGEAVLVRER